MANETTLLKYSLKTNIVKSIFFEIISKVSNYYYTFGRVTPWPTVTEVNPIDNTTVIVSSEEDPPGISDTYSDELNTRRDMIYAKQIDSNDIALVVDRINWIPGFIYDQYDDYTADRPSATGAASISEAQFYVLTDDFNVYKCLYNNNGGQSSVKPFRTTTVPEKYEDGYIWKFMYTIPISLRNKFLTSSFMPVTTSLTNQFYSRGSIINYVIEDRGFNYPKNSWKVKRVVVTAQGTGYDINDLEITFPAADLEGGIDAIVTVSEITEQGGVVTLSVNADNVGYSVRPEPLISSTQGTGLNIVVEYDVDDSLYTVLKVVGDGYNEDNPYTLKTVTVTDGGIYDAPLSGTLAIFPAPGLQTGHRPELQFTFGPILGSSPVKYEVKSVTVVDEGYGYTSPLIPLSPVGTGSGGNVNFVQDLIAGGFKCDFNVSSQKNEAELIPLINSNGEIEEIIVENAGVGYTFASVVIESKKKVKLVPIDPSDPDYDNVPWIYVDVTNNPDDRGYIEGFSTGSVLLQFGVGDIDTRQSNVELQAVNGSIPVINVDFGGSGYSTPVLGVDENNNVIQTGGTTISLVGDGIGWQGRVVVQNGVITGVDVLNAGAGYTYANVVLNPAQSGTAAAILRPIISPRGGHGKDSVAELYCNNVMLVTKLSIEKNKDIVATNDYRQVAIVKNMKAYGSDFFLRKATSSACAAFICDRTTSNTTTYNNLQKNDTLKFSAGNSLKTFTLVDKAIVDNKYYLLVQVNDSFIPAAGSTVYKEISNSVSYQMSINSVQQPDFDKYSGEMLYLNNRVKFSPSDEQTIIASTLISF